MYKIYQIIMQKLDVLCFVTQVFFNPEIYTTDFTTPLPDVIDKCIQSAPIDTRRALYKVTSIGLLSLSVFFFAFFGLLKLICNIVECSIIWRINHVQRLQPKATKGFEEDC